MHGGMRGVGATPANTRVSQQLAALGITSSAHLRAVYDAWEHTSNLTKPGGAPIGSVAAKALNAALARATNAPWKLSPEAAAAVFDLALALLPDAPQEVTVHIASAGDASAAQQRKAESIALPQPSDAVLPLFGSECASTAGEWAADPGGSPHKRRRASPEAPPANAPAAPAPRPSFGGGYRGRLAPTPSGYLHLGHARTFLSAAARAAAAGGRLLLRLEDLDGPRCRKKFEAAMYEDLRWLGLRWEEGPDVTCTASAAGDGGPGSAAAGSNGSAAHGAAECAAVATGCDTAAAAGNAAGCGVDGSAGGPAGPYRQSERRPLYAAAWAALAASGAIYASPHSRKDVERCLGAPHEGESEPVFPPQLRPEWAQAAPHALPPQPPPATPAGMNWRFRVPDGEVITFDDARAGRVSFTAGVDFGDFVVWRRDDVPAYELACVVDDYAMGVTEVVRGADLLASTARQLLLYRALGWQPPAWCHEPLVRDAAGRRLAKRSDSEALRALRAAGTTPQQLRRQLFDGQDPFSAQDQVSADMGLL